MVIVIVVLNCNDNAIFVLFYEFTQFFDIVVAI